MNATAICIVAWSFASYADDVTFHVYYKGQEIIETNKTQIEWPCGYGKFEVIAEVDGQLSVISEAGFLKLDKPRDVRVVEK